MSTDTVHNSPDRIIPPEGYVPRGRPGDPEIYLEGSPEALQLAAELERLEADFEYNQSTESAPDVGFVPDSLSRDRKENPGRVDLCPRSVRRLIADGETTIAVWLPCDSRTCGHCRPAIDESDAARIAASLGAGQLYRDTIPRVLWDRVRKRAQRAGVEAVKMQSATAADHIEILSNAPVTADARPASTGDLVDLVERRPVWAPGRSQTTGVGLISVREWEERTNVPKAEAVDSIEMDPSITVEDVEVAAEVLKIPTRREGPFQIRLQAPWRDPRMVALRAWVRDPAGHYEWQKMLWEIETAQGIRPPDEPPIEVYERLAA